MIETERLILRPFAERDLEAFAAINADPKVCEFLPAPMSRLDSDAFAKRIAEHFGAHGFCFFALELKANSEFIGFTGLNVPRFDAPFMPAVEIGWRLAFLHWGKGYASEAASAALDHGWRKLGLHSIVSFTVPANRRSRAVMERIGLRHDPAGDFDHPNLPPGSPLRRHVLYRAARP